MTLPVRSVLIESKNTDSSSVGINCADGTVKTSADTDLDIVVEGNKATTGIQLTASSSDVQLAGNLDLTATQTGQDSFASVLGISNDSGKMVVSGPTSLRLATNAPFDAKGITASGKADMSFLGDVEIAVTVAHPVVLFIRPTVMIIRLKPVSARLSP